MMSSAARLLRLGALAPRAAAAAVRRHGAVGSAAVVPLVSPAGEALFREAMAAGSLEAYFSLAAQFRTQESGALSGHTALAMALNALHIDPRRVWKGPWRWFTEDGLARDGAPCCGGSALDAVRAAGGVLIAALQAPTP